MRGVEMLDALKLNLSFEQLKEPGFKVLGKILFVTDLHWLLQFISKNRDNTKLRLQQKSIQAGLLLLVKTYDIKYVILLGDIFNAGVEQQDTEAMEDALEFFTELNEVAEVYTNFGNHEWTYGEYNPFYLYTKIEHPVVKEILEEAKFKPRKMMAPLMKCVSMLDFGNVHIHFIPYHPRVRDFVVQDNSNTYNIGVFHNDYITAESQQYYFHHKAGHGISIYGSNLFNWLDAAVFGHLHKPFTTFNLGNMRNTRCFIPGATCQRAIDEVHSNVKLPLLLIGEEQVEFTEVNFNLGNIEETVKQEIVEKERKKRTTRKFVKKNATTTKSLVLENLLDVVEIPQVRTIIAEADEYKPPISVQRYYNPSMFGIDRNN